MNASSTEIDPRLLEDILTHLRAELIEAFQASAAALRDPLGRDPAPERLSRPLAWAVLERCPT